MRPFHFVVPCLFLHFTLPARAFEEGCSKQDICCGNGICDPGELEPGVGDFCPEDCFNRHCRNHICEPELDETPDSCPQDCPPVCVPDVNCAGKCGPVDDGCGGTVDCGSCSCIPLQPAFTVSPPQAQVGETVTLTAEPATILDPPAPQWDLGNGVHLSGNPITYAWPAAGVYDLILTASEPVCRTTQLTDPFPFLVTGSGGGGGSCPHPNGVCEPDLGEDESSCPLECTPNCGNNRCDPGERIRCPSDCSPATCDTVLCDAGCAARPTFTVSDAFAAAGEPVIFSAYPNFTDATSVNWDFGDGQHCEGCATRVLHSYQRDGTYRVVLTAEENVCHTPQVSFPQFIVVKDVALRKGNDARVAESNLPTCLTPGSVYSVGITMRNTGTATWSPSLGYKLASLQDDDPLAPQPRVDMPADAVVGPLDLVTFRFSLAAPAQEGFYATSWQMIQDDLQRFGAKAESVVRVSQSCQGEPIPPGAAYACVASVRDHSGFPLPGVEVGLSAYSVPPDSLPVRADFRSGFTDQNGQASLFIERPSLPIQQLRCDVFDITTTTPPFKVVTDPVSVPFGTIIRLDVDSAFAPPSRERFSGLRDGDGVARLYLSGKYDKPVVIPMPFDPFEQTPGRFTEESLYAAFSPFLKRAFASGYDVWLMKTLTQQNIHEQAAEFAQLISRAAELLPDPDGKVIVAGYSLGGVTARLSTARYQADPGWRRRLRVTDRLPVSLVAFGDAPLQGAHVNLCLQQGVWDLGHQKDFNLDSCGAQQLLDRAVPGNLFEQDPGENWRRFFLTGEAVRLGGSPGNAGSGCDRVELGIGAGARLCVCEAGPAVFSVNDGGFAVGPRLVAFSDGQPGRNTCYGDGRDLNRDGISVCPGITGLFPISPNVGDPIYKVALPLAPDRTCTATAADLQGGSRFATTINQFECFGPICGGISSSFAATFIPFESALPGGAPFARTLQNDFQGVHGRGYIPSIQFLLEEMDAVSGTAPLSVAAATSSTAQPVDAQTGTAPLTVTFPNVVEVGTTTLAIGQVGPAPFPGYVPGTPPTFYDLSTTTFFHAATYDPITVCANYAGTAFMDENRIKLFHFEKSAWMDITSFRDPETRTVCGTATTLSPFALFEPMNVPPVANAGPDQVVEATGPDGADVVLNGAASIDPDGDPLVYEWRDESGTLLASTPVARRKISLGLHRVTLTLKDKRGAVSSATTAVEVRDTVPPELSLAVQPAALWPPNHRLVPITASIEVRDVVDPSPAVRLESIACDDSCNPAADIAGAAPGADVRSFQLRATRTGSGRGRSYTITYSATDFSGNVRRESASVQVPHDQGQAR